MTTPTIPFYPVTHDDGTNIVSALNSIASARRTPLLIADAFSNLTDYEVNDYVIYENNLYRFTASHPAGSWNYSQVVRVSLGEELERKVDNSAVAPEFRNDANYAVGDVVSYKGGLYRYLSPHIEGDWDRTEVVATNAISEGGGGGGGGTGVGDEITFDGDNMIITSSGRSIESLESSIAIVANGNTHPLIYSGEYVYVKMHDTLPEGLYTANSNIVETDDLTTSNLSSVSKGGMNSIAERGTDPLRGHYIKFNNGFAVVWRKISYDHPADIQWGSMYVTDFWDMDSNGFPFTFSALPKIFLTEVFISTSGIILDIKDTTVSSWGKLRCARPNNARVNCEFDCFAIGFWK